VRTSKLKYDLRITAIGAIGYITIKLLGVKTKVLNIFLAVFLVGLSLIAFL